MSAKQHYICWNGCNDFEMSLKGSAVYNSREKFEAFPVVEVRKSTFPVDSDGEVICVDGTYTTECGRFFKNPA